MLGVGDRIPEATVFPAPREPAKLPDLAGGEAMLLLFYLFDWTST